MRSKKRNPKCFLSKDAYKCSGQKASYNRNSLRWGYAKGSGTTITENRYIGMTRTKSISQEIWDNSIDIMEELKAPSHPDNHYVFRVPTRNIKGSVYVPRYYWKKYSVQIEERAKKEHFQLVSIQKLL